MIRVCDYLAASNCAVKNQMGKTSECWREELTVFALLGRRFPISVPETTPFDTPREEKNGEANGIYM